ncbi:MAG: SDR family oxidoreductase [Verrucomicrobiota bacterium]
MNLKDKVCLVTGGTRGIGSATAVALAEAGAHVAVIGRTEDEESAATIHKLKSIGKPFASLCADCAQLTDIQRCVRETLAKLGPVDVFVHSAGGPVPGGLFEIDSAAWHAAFEIHVHAIFHFCREIIPMMQKKKEGAVVLISSTAGIRGVPINLAYQVVKGALPQFTRALAREFANDNIRVNCVAPGVIRTRFHASMTEQQRKLNLEHRIPLHREGTSEQVASLILELIRNDYITGETMTIDGGLTMRIA